MSNDVMEERRRENCRAFLKLKRISPTAAARTAGIPPTTLHSYLDGKAKTMLATTQEKLARGLDTTVERLFGGPASIIDARQFALAYGQCRFDTKALATGFWEAVIILLMVDPPLAAALTVAWEQLNPGAPMPGLLLAVLTRGNEEIAGG